MSTPEKQVFHIPLDSTANQQDKTRKIQFDKLAKGAKKKAFLNFNDDVHGIGGKYKIPLGKLTPDKNGTNASDINVLVPLVPFLYSTPELDKSAGIQIREGWLYVYVNGYLWRELEVLKNGYMRDVNLTYYQNWYYRKANCEKDSRLVLPHKLDGKEQTVEVCFSEVQWGWSYINKMGGMDPDDPRLNPKTTMPKGSDAAQHRAKRMTKITNLSDYKDGFENSPETAEIININKTKLSIPYIWKHKPSKLGALFLHDPVGIAKILKQEHLRTSLVFEETLSLMATEEYSLAVFTNELLASEEKSILADPKSKKQIDDELSNSQLSDSVRLRQFTNQPKSEQERLVQKHQVRYKEALTDISSMRKVLDIEKINKAVTYWEDRRTTDNKAHLEAGKKVIAFIDDDSQAITFDDAMQDYFKGNSSGRFALGLSRMCFFIEYFSFKEGLEYLTKLTKEQNRIGRQMCSPKALKQHQSLFIALEEMKQANFRPADKRYKIDADEMNRLAQTGLGLASKVLENFSKIKATTPEGLDWLVKLSKSYLGEGLDIKRVDNALISFLYNPEKHISANSHHFLADKNTKIANMKMSYLSLDGSTPAETLKRLKDPTLKLRFQALQGVLEIINFASAYNKVFSDSGKPSSPKEQAALAGAFVGIAKLATEVVEHLLSTSHIFYKATSANFKNKSSKVNSRLTNARRNSKIKSRRTWKKYHALKGKAAQLSEAGILASNHAAKLGRWTGIASSSARILGVIGSTIMIAQSAYEYEEQTSTNGRIAVGAKLIGNILIANEAFRVLQISVYAYRATVAAVTGTTIMASGLATLEFGIGFVLVVVGFAISVIGEIFLQEANRPRLIKDLDYCFFGKHQYGEWVWGDTNKHKRVENKEQKSSKDGTVNEYLYNFSAEKSRIYCNLFEYDGFVEFGRIIDKPNKRYDGYVIHGSFIPGQIIQNKSSVFVNFKVTTQDKLTGYKKTLLIKHKDIKSKEIYKDSNLVSVDFYYKLTDEEIKDVKEVVMATQLDINGTGELLLPVDEAKNFKFHLTYGAQAFPEWKYGGNKITKRTSEGEPPRFKAHEIEAVYSS